MDFKSQIREDFSVFLNLNEFSEMHTVNGKPTPCMVDNNELLERRTVAKAGVHVDGLFLADLLLYARTSDLGGKPVPGRMLMLDKRPYKVIDAVDEMGICSVYLEANRI